MTTRSFPIDEAIKSLTGKGYLEFNELDYLYIYLRAISNKNDDKTFFFYLICLRAKTKI